MINFYLINIFKCFFSMSIKFVNIYLILFIYCKLKNTKYHYYDLFYQMLLFFFLKRTKKKSKALLLLWLKNKKKLDNNTLITYK
jgi:hypothetical protein